MYKIANIISNSLNKHLTLFGQLIFSTNLKNRFLSFSQAWISFLCFLGPKLTKPVLRWNASWRHISEAQEIFVSWYKWKMSQAFIIAKSNYPAYQQWFTKDLNDPCLETFVLKNCSRKLGIDYKYVAWGPHQCFPSCKWLTLLYKLS